MSHENILCLRDVLILEPIRPFALSADKMPSGPTAFSGNATIMQMMKRHPEVCAAPHASSEERFREQSSAYRLCVNQTSLSTWIGTNAPCLLSLSCYSCHSLSPLPSVVLRAVLVPRTTSDVSRVEQELCKLVLLFVVLSSPTRVGSDVKFLVHERNCGVGPLQT